MKSGSRLIKDEEYSLLLGLRTIVIHREEVGQLYSLAFTSGKRTAALSELDVRKSHIHKRLKPFSYPLCSRVILRTEECNSLLDTEIQDVVDVLILVTYFQDLWLEAFSGAGLTDHCDICHKLHSDLHETFSLTFRAASSVDVE